MSQLPSILRETNNADAPVHVGGILSSDEPLCQKLSSAELELVGWVSSRGWTPRENFCRECFELYRQGLAWKPPSARG